MYHSAAWITHHQNRARTRYLPAGVLASLACLTRIQGLALLPALAVFVWAALGWRARGICAALLLLPSLIAEMVFQGTVCYVWRLPSPMAAIQRHWHVHTQPPWATIQQNLAMLHSARFSLSGPPPYNFAILCNLSAALLAVLLLILGIRRLPLAWTIYGGTSWIIALSHLESTSRYISVIFPLYVTAGIVLAHRRHYRLVLCCSALLLGILSLAYLLGEFVA